jgi:hypothetical protein
MFTPLITTGFVLLIAGLFGSRYLGERAMRLLSSEEKLKLLDSFSGLRVFGVLPLLIIGFSFIGIGYLPQSFMWPAYLGGWALIALFFFIIHRIIFRKMTELGINSDYLSAQRKARLLLYGGFMAFFILNTLSSFV